MKEERKTYCISHGKDVDGIASASIVKLANGGKTFWRRNGSALLLETHPHEMIL